MVEKTNLIKIVNTCVGWLRLEQLVGGSYTTTNLLFVNEVRKVRQVRPERDLHKQDL